MQSQDPERQPLLPRPQPISKKRTLWQFILACSLVTLLLTLAWTYFWYIPHRIQSSLDADDGSLLLHSLDLNSLEFQKLHFALNASLQMNQDSPATVQMHPSALSLQLTRNAQEPITLASTLLPNLFISAHALSAQMLWTDALAVLNPEFIQQMILDFTSTTTTTHYSLYAESHPRFSIPGIIGSWPMLYTKKTDFVAGWLHLLLTL